MDTQAPHHHLPRSLRPTINWAFWCCVLAALVLHSVGAVAVSRAPDSGLVEVVDGMLHHLIIRDPVVIDLPPTQPPPPPLPPPEPPPEEVLAVAQVKKVDDTPAPAATPLPKPIITEPPTKQDPVEVPVAVLPPPPKPKPKPKPAPKQPKPEPKPEPIAAVAPAPQAQAFEAAPPSTAPIAAAPSPAPTGAADGTPDGTDTPSTSALAATSARPTHGSAPTGDGTSKGGSDDIDRQGVLKAYLKEVNAAVQRRYEYPRSALRMRLEGTVIISVTIDAQGKILNAKVHTSSGHAVLDDAALAAISSLGSVPAPPAALDWTTKTVKIPYKYSLRQG